jgi:hypothetical protein
MSLIKLIIKKIFFKKSAPLNHDIYEALLKASHDLKNNLITIKLITNTIEKLTNQPIHDHACYVASIEKSLLNINIKINHSLTFLNMMTIHACPAIHWPQETSNLSIASCIQKSIEEHPFTSSKQASFINIENPAINFYFSGNEYLTKSIFYCIIKNAFESSSLIDNYRLIIKLDTSRRAVHFIFKKDLKKNNTQKTFDLFYLGIPSTPRNGFNFINTVMTSIGGSTKFKYRDDDKLIMSLLFDAPVKNPQQIATS